MSDTAITRVQEKRQRIADAREEAAKTQSIIDAVTSSGEKTKSGVISAVQDLALSTLVAKDPRLAKVSTGLGDLLKEIASAGNDLKKSGLGSIAQTFDALIVSLKDLPKQVAATDKSDQLIPYLKQIAHAVESYEPVIRPHIDTTPISKVLQEHFDRPDEEGVDLSQFKAHNLVDDGETLQYIGFVNVKEQWYIIQNDVEGNTLRYKFGNTAYRQAWKKRTNHRYRLLSEAVNEITA